MYYPRNSRFISLYLLYKNRTLQSCLLFMVELTGVEPVSKSCPTSERLQFRSLLDKTVYMRVNHPYTEFTCELSGSSYRLRNHLILRSTHLCTADTYTSGCCKSSRLS